MSVSRFQSTYAKIRTDIIFGTLPPSQKLRLELVQHQYGASVPTIREVLNRLASEGFVVVEDARGFAVAPISAANLMELASLRKLVELHALKKTFANGDVEWEASLIAAHYKLSRMEKLLIAGKPADRAEWKRYDFSFHQSLIHACNSQELLALHGAVFDKYLRYQMIFLTFRGEIAAREHQQLLDAALKRDYQTAAEVLEMHIDGGVEHALKAQAKV